MSRPERASQGSGSRPKPGDVASAVLLVLAVAVLLAVVTVVAYSWASPAMSTRHRTPQALSPHMHWLQGWSWWDGEWYIDIVRRGYYFIPHRMSSVAFFPMYPLLIRALSPIFGDPVASGVVVTLGCGIGASVMFYVWAHERLGRDTAWMALALFLAYPCSFYLFGAVYADSVFLLLAVSAFVLVEHDRPGWAGLLAALATATRPVGLAVVIGLWARAVERRGLLKREAWRRRSVRHTLVALRADIGLLLAPLGLVAYIAYLWERFHDPLAFVHAQEGWAQAPGIQTWLKVGWLRQMYRRPYLNAPHLHLVASALITLLAVALAGLVFRRLGAGYGLFVVAMVVGSALSTGDFIGMGRYVLGAFPLFAVAGDALAQRPGLARPVLVVSATLLVVTIELHARNMLIS